LRFIVRYSVHSVIPSYPAGSSIWCDAGLLNACAGHARFDAGDPVPEKMGNQNNKSLQFLLTPQTRKTSGNRRKNHLPAQGKPSTDAPFNEKREMRHTEKLPDGNIRKT